MTEDDARLVELVRAIETEDRDAALLTAEDRAHADARARQAAGAPPMDHAAQDRFLAARAQFAAARLFTRHRDLQRAVDRGRWPAWVGWAVPLIALAFGFLANELGTARRLELLAVPLLGTITWNLAVYIGLLALPLLRRRTRGAPRLIGWLGGIGQRRDGGTALDRAAAAFRHRWAQLSAPLTAARASRMLHLAAALFVVGLIAGIYGRALVIEYRAGWESTFLSPRAVHTLLSLVLGPASAATGVAIPPVDTIAAMRWPPGAIVGAGGVNAGPWLHLYTATLAGLVIVPRLILAAIMGARAWRLARRFPVAGTDDFYTRRLLRSASGRSGAARVTPYAFRPDETMRARLETILRAVLGDGARVTFDAPVDYGAEDGWLATATLSPADDYHIVVFNLSSTPEAENHGHFAAQLAARLRREQPGTVPAALIEEGALRERFAGEGGLAKRIDTRLAAWRDVLAPAELAPLGIDLRAAGDDDDALIRRVEAGLLPDGALTGSARR